MDGWMDGWMTVAQMDEWTDGQPDRPTDRWTGKGCTASAVVPALFPSTLSFQMRGVPSDRGRYRSHRRHRGTSSRRSTVVA